jgi:hypothetical protein
MGTIEWKGDYLTEGSQIRIGGTEVRICGEVDENVVPNCVITTKGSSKFDGDAELMTSSVSDMRYSSHTGKPFLLSRKLDHPMFGISLHGGLIANHFVNARHDPYAEGAIVMKRPSSEQNRRCLLRMC